MANALVEKFKLNLIFFTNFMAMLNDYDGMENVKCEIEEL